MQVNRFEPKSLTLVNNKAIKQPFTWVSTRELRALGITINNSNTNTTNQNIKPTIVVTATTAL